MKKQILEIFKNLTDEADNYNFTDYTNIKQINQKSI